MIALSALRICLALALFAPFAATVPTPSTISTLSNAPTPSFVASGPAGTLVVPFASDDPNQPLWSQDTDVDPEPIRGNLGAPIVAPQNVKLDQMNPDLFAPPSTDAGTILNAKWPFSLSSNSLYVGGWTRQQNVGDMPIATEMAGVNMRLEPGVFREFHWHKTSEWAYVLKGYVQISAVNADGQNYLATVGPGDLWYFPPGLPHSLQATDDSKDGAEFLLVFDNGTFSEHDTFSLTDWMRHTPKEVLAKNFQTAISAFDQIPNDQLYIFPAAPPAKNSAAPEDPYGTIPDPFSFNMSQMATTPLEGGSVKIVDSRIFRASTQIAVAEVTVKPGAMRELHWHPTQDEWGFFLEGEARVTLFGSSGNARTFDYRPGDISYIPASFGHYVENTGNTTLKFLEIFKTDRFQDISLSQWLAVVPPELVKAHLHLSDDIIAKLPKTKPIIVT